MKTTIVLASLLLLTACEKSVEVQEPKPSIEILELYGNDAIDATVVYSVNPDGETFILHNDDTLQVFKTAERIYTGIFPAPPPIQREIVLISKNDTTRLSF